MRLKTQFQISILTFGVILALIGSSVAVTQLQITQLSGQESIVREIQTGASNLNYISNNYFLYQFNSSIGLWQTEFSTLSRYLEQLNLTTSNQQSLVVTVKDDLANLNTVFDGVVSFIDSVPRNESVRVLPGFQTQWNRMAVQIQAISFDTQQLSQAIKDQSNLAIFTNTVSTIALMSSFAVFFIAIYLLNFRRTLKSISELKMGINIIGSGNLEHEVQAGSKDEIADISKSINQMSANLKAVTSSKIDLEKEISERKKAELEIAQAKQRLEAHMNNAPEAVIEFDPQFRVIRWSEEASRIFGWSANEIAGRSIAEIPWVYKDDVEIVQQVSADMLNGKSPRNVIENRNYRKDGTVVDCEWYNSAIYDENGNLVSILSQVIDVTERKRAQEALKQRTEELERMQVKLEERSAEVEEYASRMEELAEERALKLKDAERLATIGATAGMVGHDIRNPLQAITGDIFLAKTDLIAIPESEEKRNIQESLMEIEKNVDYINKIVADLQDFARPLKPNAEEIDLKSIVDDLLKKNSLPENVNVIVNLETDARKVVADSTFMNRIMYNLVTNAVQAMPKGGKLTIHAYKEAKDILITVKDTGVGIPEKVKGKLFTPMFTTKSKGQGFGLAVIKRMTESLGGTVSFESEEGKGTTFTVRLPISKVKR